MDKGYVFAWVKMGLTRSEAGSVMRKVVLTKTSPPGPVLAAKSGPRGGLVLAAKSGPGLGFGCQNWSWVKQLW